MPADQPQHAHQGGIRCSCGWTGPNWPEAKDHIVAAMFENETADVPTVHEVRAAEAIEATEQPQHAHRTGDDKSILIEVTPIPPGTDASWIETTICELIESHWAVTARVVGDDE